MAIFATAMAMAGLDALYNFTSQPRYKDGTQMEFEKTSQSIFFEWLK
jgi:hypothetical protein